MYQYYTFVVHCLWHLTVLRSI